MKPIIPIIPISIAILLVGISIHPLPSQVDPSPPPYEKTSGTYQHNDDALLNIHRIDPGFRAEKIAIPYDRKEGKLGGVIENNLYDSLGDDGESALLGCGLSHLFSCHNHVP